MTISSNNFSLTGQGTFISSTSTSFTQTNLSGNTFSSIVFSFSALSSFGSLDPLTNINKQLLKRCIKKEESNLEQTSNAELFKESLISVLHNLLTRLDDQNHIQLCNKLIHDLKNRNLVEILTKYYRNSANPSLEGTIISELRSILGDEEKVKKLSQNEAASIQTKLSAEFEAKAGNHDNLMSLLVRARQSKYPEFNCYVVDINDFSACLQSIKAFPTGSRFQLLVRNDVHYTAVDIECGSHELRAAVMDAGGDAKCEEIAAHFVHAGCQFLYLLGRLSDQKKNIQSDTFNCAFFSFDSVAQSSKDPNFFSLLEKVANDKKDPKGWFHVAWLAMPPKYVRNATSTTFIQTYSSENPEAKRPYKNEESFLAYMNSQRGERMIGGKLRLAHTVLEQRVAKQLGRLQKDLTQYTNSEILKQINKVSAQALCNPSFF